MIKRYITAFLAFMAVALSAMAADDFGWSKYPLVGEDISSIVQSKDKVYYVSAGNLFSYDESTQETYCYDSLNKLTGNKVDEIFYNFIDGFLLITYEDGNLDVLYDDGELLNLPEIRDSSITSSKAINDVAFNDNSMLLGTDFGIVIYDLGKMEVRESGIFNLAVNAVSLETDRMLVYVIAKDEWSIFHAPLDGRHNNLSRFTKLGFGLNTDAIVPLSATKYLFRNSSTGQLYTREVSADRNSWTTGDVYIGITSKSPIRPFKGGYLTTDDQNLITIADGEVRRTSLPENLRGQKPAAYSDPSKVWLADGHGIGKYDISNPASVSVLSDKAIPVGVTTVTEVGFMRWSADGERLYIQNVPYSNFRAWASSSEGTGKYQTLNIIEDGFPRDASLFETTADHKDMVKWQQQNGDKRLYGDPNQVIEDPDDPGMYYCSTNFGGVYVAKLNETTGLYEEVGRFTDKNSTIPEEYGYRTFDLNIDPQGNLWVGHFGGSGYSMLPAEKRRKAFADITVSDWKSVSKLNVTVTEGKDMRSLVCRKSNMIFFISGNYDGFITAYDTKGTYSDLTDDVAYTWTRFTDQDGITFEPPTHIACAIEDERGRVWLGTSQGVLEITTPSQATNPQMTVRRIKVPRNDGTDYADYLLGSDMIYAIALDPAGRKWIATEASGLFLVSETGDKIIRNFTADNSPLPSNLVTSVECDPKSNKVYVGTPEGLYSFLSDATPGMNSLSDILAYPNPVRPEFSGEVTITGLMDNSIVKIADAQGNVIYQTRSQAGMATWNPYTSSGSRVRTGVYFIYVTSSDGNKQVGGVSKVMVIN